jgi:hypothetical protein
MSILSILLRARLELLHFINYKTQLNFINFIRKQLNLRVDIVSCSVSLVDNFSFIKMRLWWELSLMLLK